jgi:O-methyltransferase
MTAWLKHLLRALLRRAGYDLVASAELETLRAIPEASAAELAVIERVRPFTMTSRHRIWSCIQATRYVCERGLAGDFVECGVWRGGSSMAAALTFLSQGDTHRTIWLFDTFEGMTPPRELDRSAADGAPASAKYEVTRTDAGSSWCLAEIDDVEANLRGTGYPIEQLRFVKGPVELTLADPDNLPDRIALLRLDTDWYESTRVELEALFDRVEPGGVLIIDDYGAWEGARKAVDEFFAGRPERYLLHRVDSTGRVLVKA